MGAVVVFRVNGRDFDVEEGSPTFERLSQEGYKPVVGVSDESLLEDFTDAELARLEKAQAKTAAGEKLTRAEESVLEKLAAAEQAKADAEEEAAAGLSDTPPA